MENLIHLIDIALLKENATNPRRIKDEKFKQLVKSIKEFPQMLRLRPLVVTPNNVILGGNMRYRACKEAGITSVPVVYADELTEAQQKEFLIKDNVAFGEWDWGVLSDQWELEQLTEWAVDFNEYHLNNAEVTDEDWATHLEEKGDTSLHDGLKQITFVLPVPYLDKLKTWLQRWDKNKDAAMQKMLDEV